MKTCIITGAGRGIGRAAALALAENDEIQNFVLLAVGMDELEETKRLIEEKAKMKKNVLIYDQDIIKYEEVRKIVDDAYAKFGNIDVLLNIAGISKQCDFLDIPFDLFKLTFEINVFAMFNLCQHVTRYMKKTGGVILNIGSTSGSTPRPGWLPYAASKSAVIGMSRTLTEEVKNFDIKVFNLSPGRCATKMRKGLRPDEDESKIMQPEEVGKMISFFVANPDCDLDGQDLIIRRLLTE